MRALNCRLDEVQAPLLRVFLRHLAQWNEQRRRLAAVYDREPEGLAARGLRPVGRDPRAFETGIHYPVPLHRQPAFQTADRCPIAERAAEEILSLPLWPFLPEEDVRSVAGQIRKFYA